MREYQGATIATVTAALYRKGHGEFLAKDLDVPGSIQSVSNALRHAERYGFVKRREFKPRVSIWSLTDEARSFIAEAERGRS